MSKMYVPFSYERYGRIEVEADSREEAIEKARQKLDNMCASDMDAMSDYLVDSEEIDDEGIILDENNNIV